MRTLRQIPVFLSNLNILSGRENLLGSVRDLGTLGGWSDGYGVNNGGHVTGLSNLPDPLPGGGNQHPFVYTEASGMVDLGVLPGAFGGIGRSINDNGQIAGHNLTSGFGYRAILTSSMTDNLDLGTLGGEWSQAWDINNKGQVTGWAHTSGGIDGKSLAFIWTASEGMHDIGSLGGRSSAGYGINENGQVVGESSLANIPYPFIKHAFLYTEDQGMMDLGTLTGKGNSVAYDINDYGQVVGQSDIKLVALPISHGLTGPSATSFADSIHAFRWTEDEGMIDLGHLGGGESTAQAINNHGVIVGHSKIADGEWHPFRWTEEEGMVDLNTLIPRISGGWYLRTAHDINEAGQIVGHMRKGGDLRAYRYDPPSLIVAVP